MEFVAFFHHCIIAFLSVGPSVDRIKSLPFCNLFTFTEGLSHLDDVTAVTQGPHSFVNTYRCVI